MQTMLTRLVIPSFFVFWPGLALADQQTPANQPQISPSTLCRSYVAAKDNSQITGYTSSISYAPGELFDLRVSSPSKSFSVAIFKEGLESKAVFFQKDISGAIQPLPVDPYLNDLNWPTSLSFPIPNDWGSGLYNAVLVDASKRCFETVFVVHPSEQSPKPKLVLLASNLTWQAYNDWGGASLYSCRNLSPRCYVPIERAWAKGLSLWVNTGRPMPNAYINAKPTGDEQYSKGLSYLIRWLQQNDYAFDLITDTDLDQNPHILQGYKALIFERHSEYWTTHMYDNLEKYLSKGGNLINLGGNQISWKIAIKGNLIETRKDVNKHILTDIAEPGGYWKNLGRPQERVLGIRYTSPGIGKTNRAAYRVLNPDHWVFKNTQLTDNALFGEGCSGWETDKVNPDVQPPGLVVLARGVNTDENFPDQQAGADMVFYQNSAGGKVFSVGSMAFLHEGFEKDPIINQIMKNVFEEMLH